MDGDHAHWQLIGSSSILEATNTGFKVNVYHPTLRGNYLTYYAQRYNWKLNWVARTDKTTARLDGGGLGQLRPLVEPRRRWRWRRW